MSGTSIIAQISMSLVQSSPTWHVYTMAVDCFTIHYQE